MNESENDTQIQITHFVNPHVFYFKWVKEGKNLDEKLIELESKLIAIAKESKKGNKKETVNGKEAKVMRVGHTIAYFVFCWHKYIRCVIKSKDEDGRYYLWAQDYGVPFVGHQSDCLYIPLSFAGMNTDVKVHLGGLIDCIPAEKQVNFETMEVELATLRNWSPTAVETFRKVIKNSVALKFEGTKTFDLLKKPHILGRLMYQVKNGTWHTATKCLLDIHMGKIASGHLASLSIKHDTLQQPIWKTSNDVPLTYASDVVQVPSGAVSKEFDEANAVLNERLQDDPIDDNDDVLSVIHLENLSPEDEKCFMSSVSCINVVPPPKQPNQKIAFSNAPQRQAPQPPAKNQYPNAAMNLHYNNRYNDDRGENRFRNQHENRNANNRKWTPNGNMYERNENRGENRKPCQNRNVQRNESRNRNSGGNQLTGKQRNTYWENKRNQNPSETQIAGKESKNGTKQSNTNVKPEKAENKSNEKSTGDANDLVSDPSTVTSKSSVVNANEQKAAKESNDLGSP